LASDKKLGFKVEVPVEEDEPVERNDLRPGFTSRLDQEASERKAIYDRLVAIENKMKKRGSGRFARYLVAILIGVAATLAWQSNGESAKQIVAARLGKTLVARGVIARAIALHRRTRASQLRHQRYDAAEQALRPEDRQPDAVLVKVLSTAAPRQGRS
jgi:hypothetical protein